VAHARERASIWPGVPCALEKMQLRLCFEECAHGVGAGVGACLRARAARMRVCAIVC